MFRISIGIMNGLIRDGPLLQQHAMLLFGRLEPPMPDPMKTPISSRFSWSRLEARILQGAPARIDPEMGKAVGAADLWDSGMQPSARSPGTSAAIWQSNGLGSNEAIRSMPQCPATMLLPKVSRVVTQTGDAADPGHDHPAFRP